MKATLLLAAALAAVLAGAAQAQGRLPRVSPSEDSYTGANRDLQRYERQRAIERQTQFEANQLRQELNRQQQFAPPPYSGPGRICAPGQLGC